MKSQRLNPASEITENYKAAEVDLQVKIQRFGDYYVTHDFVRLCRAS